MNNELIERSASIMLGKPVIKGTRITLEHILRELAAGTPEAELLEAHPNLTKAAIAAALEYAAELLRHQSLADVQ